MDPIAFMVNPSIRQFTEAALRTSDLLREQQKAERMEKTRAAGTLDHAHLSADSTLLSEDLLGDLDPDLGRSRGRRQKFTPMRKKHSGAEPEEEPGLEAAAEDAAEDAAEAAAGAAAEPAVELPVADGQPDVLPATTAPPLTTTEMETLPHSDAQAPLSIRPDESTPGRSGEARSEQIGQERSEKADKETTAMAVEASTADPKITAIEDEAGGEEAAGPRSLLELDADFLIADPHPHLVLGSEPDEELALRIRKEMEDGSAPWDTQSVSGELLESMMRAPRTSGDIERLLPYLLSLGSGAVVYCARLGLQIRLLGGIHNAADYLRPLPGKSADRLVAIRHGYLPLSRTCLLDEEILVDDGKFNPVRYYLALALDHALGGDEFASLNSAAVISNYQDCRRGESGHLFLSGLARLSPVHYFAVCAEAYLSVPPERGADPTRAPLAGRREFLYDHDRAMYRYVEHILGQVNRK